MTTHDFWSENRIDTLKTLWAANMTTKYIAAQIGCTKNAVVGKIARLGLPTRSGDGRTVTLRKPSNAHPRSPTIPLDERVVWAKSLLDRMTLHNISNMQIARAAGTSDSQICRLKRYPERWACTEDFRDRIESGLAEVMRAKGISRNEAPYFTASHLNAWPK